MKKTSLQTIRTAAAVFLAASALATQATASDSSWAVDAGGNYSDSLNWSAGVPGASSGNSSTDIATFPRSVITASRAVALDAAYNVGGITFNNDVTSGASVFTFGNSTVSTPNLTLTAGGVIQNSGSGNVTGNNMLDVNLVLAGNASITNTYLNSTLFIGASTGNSLNTITTEADLGNVYLTFGGTSTASNLQSMRINQAAGTTLGLIKEGTGTWQINGPGSGNSGFTGGLLFRQGTVVVGRSSGASLGTGAVVIGDGSTLAGDLKMSLGSSITVSNAMTVASSAATNVIIERLGGGGPGNVSGAITLNRDLVLRQGSTANQALNFTGTSSVAGTGNLIINSSVASAGAVSLQGSVDMAGQLINQSTLATGTVTVAGPIGSSVTGVTQNSATSNLTLSNPANTYAGNTTISAGSLLISGSGTIGDSNLVLAGGTFDITGADTGLTLAATQSVTGNGTLVTTGKVLSLDGPVAPGLAGPGLINVTGDLTLGSMAMVVFEINGTTSDLYDRLALTGSLTTGGTLSLVTGYAAQFGDTVTLFTAGGYSGSFSSISNDIGGGLFWDTTNLLVNGTLLVVPEPGTWTLLALAGLVLVAARVRARKSA